MYFIKFFSFFALFVLTLALDINSVYEGTSIKPPTVSLDLKALANPDLKWYLVLGNKYEALRTAEVFIGKSAKDLTEAETEYPCAFCTFTDLKCTAYGKTIDVLINISEDGSVIDFSDGNLVKKSYITMTDNKSYSVGINYWDNQHLGWLVFSTSPKLDEAVKNKILEHIKSFGFDMTKVFEGFQNCQGKNEL